MSRPVSLVVIALLVGLLRAGQDQRHRQDLQLGCPAPGCVVAVSEHGKLVANRAYGAADLERNVPLSTETVFDVGSVRKQFVAASILLLVEEGRLAFRMTFTNSFPSCPITGTSSRWTICSTTRVESATGSGSEPGGRRYRCLDHDPAPARAQFRPRGGWSYLWQLCAAGGSRRPRERVAVLEFARTRLFEPLGMKATSYVNDMQDVIRNRALAYEKGRRPLEAGHAARQRSRRRRRPVQHGGRPHHLERGADEAPNLVRSSAARGTDQAEQRQDGQHRTRPVHGDLSRRQRDLVHRQRRRVQSIRGPLSGMAFPSRSSAIPATAQTGPRTRSVLFDLFVPTAPAASASAAETGPPPVLTGDALTDVNSKAGLFFNEQTARRLRLAVDCGQFAVAGRSFGGQGPFRQRWGAPRTMSQDEFELHFCRRTGSS